MQSFVLKSRAGFTLVEVLVALTMTAVIGAAVTGAFVSQSRFFDHQEKVGSARSVSRSAVNIMTSEMRMVEVTGGVVAATNSAITLNVPYASALFCKGDGTGNMKVLRLPTDSVMRANAKHAGYAFRNAAGTYTYVPAAGTANDDGSLSYCSGTLSNAALAMPGVRQTHIPLATPLTTATPLFLFQRITYHFGPSGTVAGRTALYRTVQGETPEELLAPFDTTAKFRFYVSDNAVAQTAVPAVLSTITGVEITLDGLSERPNSDGTNQSVPFRTSVFFRNR